MEDETCGNKMDMHNMSTVITPNVLYCKKEQMTREDNALAIKAVFMVLDQLNEFRLVCHFGNESGCMAVVWRLSIVWTDVMLRAWFPHPPLFSRECRFRTR